MTYLSRFLAFSFIFACTCLTNCALAEPLHLAVAANFVSPVKTIIADFEATTGHKVTLSTGSTGKFYTQIKNGAPYDLFLAADSATPEKLDQEQLTVANTRFTYAIGKLVLWSAKPHYVDDQGAILQSGSFRHLAIASPTLAPYGAAALQTLKQLKRYEALKPRLVQAENIGQTWQFIASGNAELGFVALSQVYQNGKLTSGSFWMVPAHLYAPIRQDVVMLKKAQHNAAAHAFLRFLRSDAIQKRIQSYGYAL